MRLRYCMTVFSLTVIWYSISLSLSMGHFGADVRFLVFPVDNPTGIWYSLEALKFKANFLPECFELQKKQHRRHHGRLSRAHRSGAGAPVQRHSPHRGRGAAQPGHKRPEHAGNPHPAGHCGGGGRQHHVSGGGAAARDRGFPDGGGEHADPQGLCGAPALQGGQAAHSSAADAPGRRRQPASSGFPPPAHRRADAGDSPGPPGAALPGAGWRRRLL